METVENTELQAKYDNLVSELLDFFHDPVSYNYYSPNASVIAPDTYLYGKETAHRLLEDNYWKSPMTRESYNCPDGDCFTDVQRIGKQLYELLAKHEPEGLKKEQVITEYDPLMKYFDIQDGILVSYSGPGASFGAWLPTPNDKISYIETLNTLKQWAEPLGFKSEDIGTHSLRRVGSSEDAHLNLSDVLTLHHGRWRSKITAAGYLETSAQIAARIKALRANPHLYTVGQ